MRFSQHLVLSLIWLAAALPAAARADKLTSDDVTFFENRIRPVLVQHCYKCHSAEAAEVGGELLLDTRDGLLTGGESGPAVKAGQPDSSVLIQALRWDGLQMPPEEPLPESVVSDFVEWVKRGAPDPRTNDRPGKNTPQTAPTAQSDLWSLQPVSNPSPPAVTDTQWPRNVIDHFVLARIEAAGLSPAEDASPRTLIRRLYYDLIGLPPSLEVINTFEVDCQTNREAAVERLVDELLARPQFGERWGRHWLDVARYGESNGNDGLGRNPTFPHAWRYRDYVIEVFNNNTPYDHFLTEQLAGDLLPADSPEQRDRHLVATGFLAMAAKPAKAMNTNFDMDVVADQIDVIGRGVMGLSVACARCHDHKFDPVPTRDYYALAGIFKSTETMWGVAAHEALTAPVTDLHVLATPEKVLPPEGFVETVLVLESNTGQPKPLPKLKWPIGTPLAMGVRDRKEPSDAKIDIKGDAMKAGEVVPRGFIEACDPQHQMAIEINQEQSGRLELARWLTHPSHPLTARVMANRVWMHLFGTGIVATPDDFGVYGERPSHPDLLDHLATRFIADGWSVKRLIRSIVLSRTYQLDSAASEDLIAADAINQLLSRHNRRRLDAESLRDSMLQVSGQLDPAPGNGSIIRHRDILVNLAGSLHEPSNKRSVYLCYLRSSPPPELAAFDLPEFTTVTGRRDQSVIPGQALHLFNSRFVIQQAEYLAQTVSDLPQDPDTGQDADRVRKLFQRALSREPAPHELQDAVEFLHSTRSELMSSDKALAALAHSLLLTSEFRYID